MKILHIITSLKIGGAESALYNFLAKALEQQEGTHFVAYFHEGPTAEKIKTLGIKTYHVTGRWFMYDPFIYVRLKKLIYLLKPDLIHTSLWSANIIGRILGHRLSIPVLSDQHGDSMHEGWIRNLLDRWTVKWACNVVAVGDQVAASYRANIIGAIKIPAERKVISSRLLVIKNGIDVDAVRKKAASDALDRSAIGMRNTDFVVGAVGRLDPIKSYDVLITAFSLFVNALKKREMEGNTVRCPKLCIVGDGQEKERLQQLVTTLSIQHDVLFVGAQHNVFRFYPLFDLFALSSQSEGLSIALLEAMSFALPVITTHVKGQHEVLVDGVNGFLISVNDVSSYARALERLYYDKALAFAMGKVNYQRVNASFSITTVVERYYQLYRKMRMPERLL